jgi:hypothetical protein
MQVFICWSGKASHNVAEALKTFLEDTIQEVKPFLSSDSIQKGGRWLAEVSGQLSQSNFGVLCLTKENLESRWLLFEAGALSKDSTEGRVSALLVGVEASAVESPLSQFQHTGIERAEVLKLLQSINKLVPEATRRSETQLNRSFDKSWPDLEKQLLEAANLKSHIPAVPARDNDSILKEVLELVRSLVRDADAARLASIAFSNSPPNWAAIRDAAIKETLVNSLRAVPGGGSIFVRPNTGALSLLDMPDTVLASGATSAQPPKVKVPAPIKT